ncbi:MAG: tRNA lysidine(34) synthetase TilS, partial [Lachnospiraceae bacterium]|nr:tRNA lysidine(34) synthetase TilS [Lachnospiraceae bacterium]
MVNDITDRVRDYICRHEMIRSGDHVCVAVSGGADSMCLLFLLKELTGVLDFSLSAVHVEHGIRGQASVSDMEYVKTECEKAGIPVMVETVDAVNVSKITGTTLEEAARNERYRIFEGIAADRLALAHHMDDQAETFIFNALRGTGLRGLRGMLPVRDRYIRPLLCIARWETEAYCRSRGIEYRQDLTNEDTEIARNRIRHKVMPELAILNEKAAEHICEAAGELAETEEYLEQMTGNAFEECVIPGEAGDSGTIRIDIERLEALHGIIASRVIKKALITVSGRAKDIGRKHVEAVLSLAKGQSGRRADLIYGIRAFREFKTLIIRRNGRYELSDNAFLRGSILQDRPEVIFEVLDRDEVSFEEIKAGENYTKFIDYAKISGVSELSVRHRQPGDCISIKGGSKKLKDLLIEEKIPAAERDKMLLVAVGPEIVWIPYTGRIGEKYKVTHDTERILK